SRPGTVGIQQILGGVGIIIEHQSGLASLGQNLVGILNTVLSTGVSFHVAFLALEHNVGDLAVAVQIQSLIVLQNVVADHLALHVAGLSVVSANVSSLVISGNDLLGDGTVEEHQGDAGLLSHVHDGLSGVVGA